MLREDKALANQFLASHAKVEAIRNSIHQHTEIGEKIPTSVDLPLSPPAKRVLAYAAEESERMNHRFIGPPHLLLGVLRENGSFAAQLLHEHGLTAESVREQVGQWKPQSVESGPVFIGGLEQWIEDREARGGVWAVKEKRVGNSVTSFAIYAGDQPKERESAEAMTPAQNAAQIQRRIEMIVERMEQAIGQHEFEKARFYSEEERKERENLELLREQFPVEELPPRVPLLCIEIIRNERFSNVQQRCDSFIDAGVPEVWLLDPLLKRAYTCNKTDGLRECKGEILQIANPPLKMDLKKVFE